VYVTDFVYIVFECVHGLFIFKIMDPAGDSQHLVVGNHVLLQGVIHTGLCGREKISVGEHGIQKKSTLSSDKKKKTVEDQLTGNTVFKVFRSQTRANEQKKSRAT
jgi:hypothetical protein